MLEPARQGVLEQVRPGVLEQVRQEGLPGQLERRAQLQALLPAALGEVQGYR